MPTALRRAIACAFYWQHPATGVIALPPLLGFVAWAVAQFSPLDAMPDNNRAAALGIMLVGCAGLGYVALRLARYGLARKRGGLAPDAPGWRWALVDAARCATLTMMVMLLLLAPILGREGQPLLLLGYTAPAEWFGIGMLATGAALALAWPAWALARPPRRIMPFVPPRPDLGP